MAFSAKKPKSWIDGYFETYPRVKESWTKASRWHASRLCGNHLPPQALPAGHQLKKRVVAGYAERNAINVSYPGNCCRHHKAAGTHLISASQAYNLKAKMILQVHDELNLKRSRGWNKELSKNRNRRDGASIIVRTYP